MMSYFKQRQCTFYKLFGKKHADTQTADQAIVMCKLLTFRLKVKVREIAQVDNEQWIFYLQNILDTMGGENYST